MTADVVVLAGVVIIVVVADEEADNRPLNGLGCDEDKDKDKDGTKFSIKLDREG